jgi:monoamine oxidase
LHGLARQNHLVLTEMDGIPYRDSGRGLKPADEEDDAAGDLLSTPQLALKDEPFTAFLDRLDLNASRRTRVKSFVEGFNAADSDQISTRALYHQQVAEQRIRGDRAWRLPNGYVSVVDAIAAQIPASAELLLSTIAKRVVWRAGCARVEAQNGTGDSMQVNSRAVIVTAPLGVLLGKDGPGRIEFSPEPEIFQRLNLLVPGAAVRINLVFREPVWEPAAPNGSFLLSHLPHFPTWWPRRAGSGYLLTGWSGGPKALNLPVRSLDDMTDLALATLGNLLRTRPDELRSKFESAHFHDWQSDPFSRAAYSYVRAGGFEFSQQICSGIESTLWLAGEAMAGEGYWGTVHGAMVSGERAADQLLDASL